MLGAELKIEAFVGARPVSELTADLPPLRLRTAGLRARGHAELEVNAIPTNLVGDACHLLEVAAAFAIERAPFHPGRRWAARLDSGSLVTALSEGSHSVLRLLDIDADDFDDPPKTAVSALAVDRARRLRQEDEQLAEQVLTGALEWYPGEPGPGLVLDDNHLCNQGNSLGHLTHADWFDEDRSYRRALERSESLLRAELGSPPPARVTWPQLLVEVRSLVLALQRVAPPERGAPPGMCFVLSPALRLEGARPMQSVALGWPQLRTYFFEGVAAERLREASVHALVAEIYDRSHHDPIAALVSSRQTVRGHYEGGYRFESPTPTRPFEYASALDDPSPVPLLGRILATVGRDLAAGLSIPECRARWGLDAEASTLEAAASKLQLLNAREDESIRAAYGF